MYISIWSEHSKSELGQEFREKPNKIEKNKIKTLKVAQILLLLFLTNTIGYYWQKLLGWFETRYRVLDKKFE